MPQEVLERGLVERANSEAAKPLRMSFAEFLEWAGEDTHAEWVDGEVVWMSPVSREHSNLSGFLAALLRHFAEYHQLGQVHAESFLMKTGPNLPGREPEVIFVSTENLPRLKKTYLDGPADLVVEIVSPDDPKRDYVEKFQEYQAGGVPEYWIVDPERQRAEFNQLGEDGRYRAAPIGDDGIYRSCVLDGLWLRVDWLWQEPLPNLLDVLREWKLI